MRIKIIYSAIIFLLIIQGCGPSEREKEQAEFDKQKELNEKKFYYPKAYDDWWFNYNPNLINSEGWIAENCDQSGYKNQKVVVRNQRLKHQRRGSYKGTLLVELIKDKIRDNHRF